MIENKFKTGTY